MASGLGLLRGRAAFAETERTGGGTSAGSRARTRRSGRAAASRRGRGRPVRAAVDTAPDGSALPRLVVAAEGYCRWAIAHPERFRLLYGTPLRDYAAPSEGPTTHAMWRMSAIFEREMFDGFTAEQLAAAETPALSPSLRAHLEQLPQDGLGDMPAPATTLLLSAWGRLHGLVVLEVFGHTSFLASGSPTHGSS
ncbi:TetR-like C-terminal domain-containing protein [Streptomyces sp. NPDC003006]